jgi:hypothetical protein
METFCDLSTEVASSLLPGSKPTVWDGDQVPYYVVIQQIYSSKPTVWDAFFSLKFLKTKRKGFNILKAWKTGG